MKNSGTPAALHALAIEVLSAFAPDPANSRASRSRSSFGPSAVIGGIGEHTRRALRASPSLRPAGMEATLVDKRVDCARNF